MKDEMYCHFCKKKIKPTDLHMTVDNGLVVCGDCLDVAQENNFEFPEETSSNNPIPTPMEIKSYLDKYIIGQDEAKKTLAVAVYNHYMRIASKEDKKNDAPNDDDVEIEKSNILLIGPTGTGKTLLARTLATLLDVPFAIADATTLTEAGYVGDDVENVLVRLLNNADGNVEAAEKGIVFIDEIDKIARCGSGTSITRDVSGEGVQQALLKLIEGTVSRVPLSGGRKHPREECAEIDTSDILFICGGAFPGLEKLVSSRVSPVSVGFGAKDTSDESNDKLMENLVPSDLVKFGMIPEFVGRLPVHAFLNDIKCEDLIRILTEPKNAIIRQFCKAYKMQNAELVFENEAIRTVAELAIEQKTGARGLRSIIEKTMKETSFMLPSVKGSKKVLVTRNCVLGKEKPRVITVEQESQEDIREGCC